MSEESSEIERMFPGIDGQRYVFDGYCHRPYSEDTDGWLNYQIPASPAVRMAQEVIDQHNEINALIKENWELKKRLEKEGLL